MSGPSPRQPVIVIGMHRSGTGIVTDLLREELLLSQPTKPVCKEDCKGICAGCGAELNSEPCTCPPEVDPRWDALKDLKFD